MLRNKIVLLGDSGVGKTSIIRRFLTNTFVNDMSSTIGAAYIRAPYISDNVEYDMHIWDTAGQEKYRAITPIYTKSASAAIIVFDMSNKESLMSCDTWYDSNEYLKTIPLILVGNKFDVEKHAVTKDEAMIVAQRIGCEVFFTSALNGLGIKELFRYCFEQVVSTAGRTIQEEHAMKSLPETKTSCC